MTRDHLYQLSANKGLCTMLSKVELQKNVLHRTENEEIKSCEILVGYEKGFPVSFGWQINDRLAVANLSK